ncbi:NAD(P)H-hydrate epimerase [Dictyocoela muelleri]|nr:NAD(P)H-hydrate epimerase [Dictyocoela muelleri]
MKPNFITQHEAINLDKKLVEIIPLDYLIETAGFAAFEVILKIIKEKEAGKIVINKILLCIGPGNNGGDGLVIARYLKYAGFSVDIWCPKTKHLNLLQICTKIRILNIHSVNDKNEKSKEKNNFKAYPDPDNNDYNVVFVNLKEYDLIIDSLFGFSFKKPLREPYFSMIRKFRGLPVISIDVPSGYEVDIANKNVLFVPDAVVCFGQPKICCQNLNVYLTRCFLPGFPRQFYEGYKKLNDDEEKIK